MTKNCLDQELIDFLRKTQIHTPPTEDDLIHAYNLGRKVVIDKLREKVVLLGGYHTSGILSKELDKL